MSIDSDHIRHLDQFDLESVSIAEIKRLSNPVLRNVLLEAMAVTAATAVAKEHTSHGMHTPGHGMFTSHAKSELLERIFGQNVTNAPLIDSQIDRPKSNG